MNVLPAWEQGYSGKGVVVSILDDGIQPNHPDLIANYVSRVFCVGRMSDSDLRCESTLTRCFRALNETLATT